MANETIQLTWQNTLLSVYGGSVIVLGTIGNVLIVLIMYYDKNLKTTTRVLFSLLAFGDFLVLWTLLVRYFVYMTFGFDFRSRDGNELWCRVHIFLAYAASNFAMGTLCILCVDRCIAINCAVRKAVSTYSHRSARYIALAFVVLILIIFGKHLYIGWKFGLQPVTGNCDEIIKENVHYWVDFVTNTILPYLILIPANISVYIALKSHSKQMKIIGIQVNACSFAKQNRPIVKMLITISFLHFILTFPGYLFTQVLAPRNEIGLPDKVYMEIALGLLMVSFTNSAIPFYAYLCTTSRFRTTCRLTLKWLCVCPCYNVGKRKPRLSHSNYSTKL